MLKIMLFIVSCVACVLKLMMRSKSNGLLSALSGTENLSLFNNSKERGIEKTMNAIMTIVTVLYFILVIAEGVLSA